MKKNTLLTIITFLLLSPVIVKAQAIKNDAKLLAVKFHADWCKSCKAMGPAFENLESELVDRDIYFLKLDFTDEDTRVEAEKLIEEFGLTRVVKRYVGTGFILLVENEDKSVKEILNKKHSHDDMKSIIFSML